MPLMPQPTMLLPSCLTSMRAPHTSSLYPGNMMRCVPWLTPLGVPFNRSAHPGLDSDLKPRPAPAQTSYSHPIPAPTGNTMKSVSSLSHWPCMQVDRCAPAPPPPCSNLKLRTGPCTQVAHFDVHGQRDSLETDLMMLNGFLPPDVKVLNMTYAEPGVTYAEPGVTYAEPGVGRIREGRVRLGGAKHGQAWHGMC